jgi:hypothetical protein
MAGLLFREPRGDLATLDPATARVAMRLAGARAGTLTGQPSAASGALRHHLRLRVGDAEGEPWSWGAAPTCDRRAFLRGVVLGAGSLSFTPQGAHVEFALVDRADAIRLQGWLSEMGIRAGSRVRRGRQVVYIKGMDHIATLLRVTGANRAVLLLEEGRVGGEVRGRLNRALNAEAANLDRTVQAAERQLAAIAALESSGRLDRLPVDLQESARLRRRAPDADLASLAEQQGIGRSALNHRLRRLVSLAAEVAS